MSEPHQHVFVFDGRGLWTCACGEQMNELAMILPPPPVAPPLTAGPVAPPPDTLADAAEMLWIVLANVSGGDWTQQSPEWREAAARWRDNYFKALGEAPRGAARPPQPPDVEANALLEAIDQVLNGEPVSEFMESFPIVQRVQDLKQSAARPPASPPALEALTRLEAAAPHLIAMKRHPYGGSIERDIRAVAAELKALAVPPEAPPP